MKIDILTLFPDMFEGFKSESIIKRAIDNNKVEINTCNFRDFADNKHKKVDDTPYGGGNGMVLMCQPIFDAIESLKKENSKVILLSPQGEKYTQKKAYELSKEEHLIFICGHYEGFDERIKTICDEEISIGDYVLTGGELPSMVITDSIVRLIPGVIEEESHLKESFNDNLLDYPTYTKPRNYKGMEVPEVLLSGDHKKIDKWRNDERVKVTALKRPDLLKNKMTLKKEGINKVKRKINIDDIKNIKVTEIKDVIKTGKYILSKDDNTKAVTTLNPKYITGYKLKGKTKNNELTKILIAKPDFATKIAMKNVRKKIDILTYRFGMALNDADDAVTGRVLGESELLKQIVINDYSRYLGKENLDNIIKNINQITSDFVRTRTMQNAMLSRMEKNEEDDDDSSGHRRRL